MTAVLEQLVRQPTWRRHAACRDRLELFYASDATSEAIAVAVCAGCVVRQACLAEALADEADTGYRYGVRGGLTASQRR